MTGLVVLVVDDDWMSREIIEAQLEPLNAVVVHASSGKRALQLAVERTPDLVLLDVRLEDMTGYDVCAQLKNDPTMRLMPVIMVTALESESDRQMAVEAGADDFLLKPFSSLTLLTQVKRLLGVE
jgi:CheY-like chemotaxis protein